MSDYSKVYDGSAHNTNQDVLDGAEFDTEFAAIQVADNTKVDKESTQTVSGDKTLSGLLDLTGTFKIGSVLMTSTAAELNLLDGVVGLVQADFTKLAEIDATSAEIDTICDAGTALTAIAVDNNDGVCMNIDGVMRQNDVDTLDTYFASTTKTLSNKTLTSPNMTNPSIGGVAMTSSSAELNLLDGVSGLVQADFTKLAAITASATEINDLTGNAVDSSDFTKLSQVTATSGELNLIDGAIAGTSVANKALVLGASKNTDILDVDTTLTARSTPVYGLVILDTPINLVSSSSMTSVTQTAVDITAHTTGVAVKAILRAHVRFYSSSSGDLEIMIGEGSLTLNNPLHRAVYARANGATAASDTGETTVNLDTGEIFDYLVTAAGTFFNGDYRIDLIGYYV